MSGPASSSDLEVKEDRSWQEWEWTIQRVGWVLMALLIVAALAGLTGKGGPLASASAESSTGEILYPRITRWQSDEQLMVRLPPSATGEVDIELSQAVTDLFSISAITPSPKEAVATAGGYRLTFDVAPGSARKTITFDVTAGRPAIAQSFAARIGDGPVMRPTVTVLP